MQIGSPVEVRIAGLENEAKSLQLKLFSTLPLGEQRRLRAETLNQELEDLANQRRSLEQVLTQNQNEVKKLRKILQDMADSNEADWAAALSKHCHDEAQAEIDALDAAIKALEEPPVETFKGRTVPLVEPLLPDIPSQFLPAQVKRDRARKAEKDGVRVREGEARSRHELDQLSKQIEDEEASYAEALREVADAHLKAASDRLTFDRNGLRWKAPLEEPSTPPTDPSASRVAWSTAPSGAISWHVGDGASGGAQPYATLSPSVPSQSTSSPPPHSLLPLDAVGMQRLLPGLQGRAAPPNPPVGVMVASSAVEW